MKKWNLKSIRERALKYKSQRDFKKYDPQAYRASKRIGVFAEIVEHMTREGNKAKLPIKKLSFLKKCDIAVFIEARAIVGLKPLTISIRKCIACGTDFESIEARTCGCLSELDLVTRFDPFLI